MARPNKRSSLACLTKKRLITLAREFELDVAQAEPKEAFVDAIAHSRSASLERVLEELSLPELKAIYSEHGIAEVDGLSRDTLIDLLARAACIEARPELPPLMSHDGVPRAGQALAARGRQWTRQARAPRPTPALWRLPARPRVERGQCLGRHALPHFHSGPRSSLTRPRTRQKQQTAIASPCLPTPTPRPTTNTVDQHVLRDPTSDAAPELFERLCRWNHY